MAKRSDVTRLKEEADGRTHDSQATIHLGCDVSVVAIHVTDTIELLVHCDGQEGDHKADTYKVSFPLSASIVLLSLSSQWQ